MSFVVLFTVVRPGFGRYNARLNTAIGPRTCQQQGSKARGLGSVKGV